MARRVSRAFIDQVVRLANEQTSIAEIAAEIGTDYFRVHYIVTGLRLPFRRERQRFNWLAVKRLADGSRSAPEIAELLGCDTGYVRKTAARKRLPLRRSDS